MQGKMTNALLTFCNILLSQRDIVQDTTFKVIKRASTEKIFDTDSYIITKQKRSGAKGNRLRAYSVIGVIKELR